MNKYQQYIQSKVSGRDILEQLAEESGELCQASLKLIRAEKLSQNVTPITRSEAIDNLNEEIDDIYLCYSILNELEIDDNYPKLKRWAERLGYIDD